MILKQLRAGLPDFLVSVASWAGVSGRAAGSSVGRPKTQMAREVRFIQVLKTPTQAILGSFFKGFELSFYNKETILFTIYYRYLLW